MKKEIENAEDNYNLAFGNFMSANLDVCRTRNIAYNGYKDTKKELTDVVLKDVVNNLL